MLTIILLLNTTLALGAGNHRFYANPAIQAQAPAAFALQPEALAAIRAIAETGPAERENFLRLLEANPILKNKLANFAAVNEEERLAALREVFVLEVRALGIEAPELIIEDDITPGPAFFDFDPKNPGPGRVLLNPKQFKDLTDPLGALSLLIHETRHSAQFQLAYTSDTALARGYRAAFEAQKELTGFSFCDFTLLLNEYEAFQFANFVLGAIHDFRLDHFDMGTYASQYDASGKLKIDLVELADEYPGSLLLPFNELAKAQYRRMGGTD